MKNKEKFLSINEILTLDFLGKIAMFGDDDFSDEHEGYDLRGEIESFEFKGNGINIKFKWSEILFNNYSHSSSDWMTYKKVSRRIRLIPGKSYKYSNGKLYFREKKFGIVRSYIYIDMKSKPRKIAKC